MSILSFFSIYKLGSTAIGIMTPEGVVLAVEKRITSPLILPNSIEKIVEIDSHICQ
jgi:20S proteasome subunit alpha 5